MVTDTSVDMYDSFNLSTKSLFPNTFDNDERSVKYFKKGVTLSWKNITVRSAVSRQYCRYRGTTKKVAPEERKVVVKNGIVLPGTLLAILGASGAGKSTLLNVLTRRNNEGLLVEGEILIDGQNACENMTTVSGYVQQDDVFIGSLTVEEHLWFQCLLKMDPNLSRTERWKKMDTVIREVGLHKCRDVCIGIPGKVKGISGGERRRLNFASEIITDPQLLLCDEPTSGLDSYMSHKVVKILKNMAEQGKTIICTIHQPSSEVFALFDRLLLMAEGQVAFLGPPEGAQQLFAECSLPCPVNYNPADHYVLMLAMVPEKQSRSKKQIMKVCKSYMQSQYASAVERQLTDNYYHSNAGSDCSIVSHKQRYKCCWFAQFSAVLWRSWLISWKEPEVLKTRTLQSIVLGLLFGLIYYQQKNNQASVTNINGAMYILLIQITFGFIFSVLKTFPAEFPIFKKEHHDHMYRVDVYFLSKVLSELPQFVLIPCITCTIVYWMAGLYPSAEAFAVAVLAVFLVCNVSVSFGYLLSSSSSNMPSLLTSAPIFIVPISLIGGLYIDLGSIPKAFLWLKYLSWFTYANEILVVNHWSRILNITCSVNIALEMDSYKADKNYSNMGFDYSQFMKFQDVTDKCFRTGNEVIQSMGYIDTKKQMIFNFSMLVVQIVVFMALAFLALFVRSRKRMNIIKPVGHMIGINTSTC